MYGMVNVTGDTMTDNKANKGQMSINTIIIIVLVILAVFIGLTIIRKSWGEGTSIVGILPWGD